MIVGCCRCPDGPWSRITAYVLCCCSRSFPLLDHNVWRERSFSSSCTYQRAVGVCLTLFFFPQTEQTPCLAARFDIRPLVVDRRFLWRSRLQRDVLVSLHRFYTDFFSFRFLPCEEHDGQEENNISNAKTFVPVPLAGWWAVSSRPKGYIVFVSVFLTR